MAHYIHAQQRLPADVPVAPLQPLVLPDNTGMVLHVYLQQLQPVHLVSIGMAQLVLAIPLPAAPQPPVMIRLVAALLAGTGTTVVAGVRPSRALLLPELLPVLTELITTAMVRSTIQQILVAMVGRIAMKHIIPRPVLTGLPNIY